MTIPVQTLNRVGVDAVAGIIREGHFAHDEFTIEGCDLNELQVLAWCLASGPIDDPAEREAWAARLRSIILETRSVE